jgi:hypothetical protein
MSALCFVSLAVRSARQFPICFQLAIQRDNCSLIGLTELHGVSRRARQRVAPVLQHTAGAVDGTRAVNNSIYCNSIGQGSTAAAHNAHRGPCSRGPTTLRYTR